MSVNCSVCGLDCVNENDSIKCVGVCQCSFHLKCVSGGNQDTLKTRGAKKEWQCESCKPAKASSVASGKSTTSSPITKEFLIKTLESFKSEVFEELRKNTKEFAEFRTSLEFFSEKVDKSNELMEEVRESCKKIKKENFEIKEENRVLKKSVASLEQRMRNMEQYSRQSNIEISGVPETKGENMEDLLEDVAKAVNVELKKERVVAAHRVPTYDSSRVPSIIVKFTTRLDRDIWIQAFREVRPLTADKINRRFSKAKVFINEHLSPENKQLLNKTKERAKEQGYKYVWSREGKIFVRWDKGEKCIKVEGIDDLEKL